MEHESDSYSHDEHYYAQDDSNPQPSDPYTHDQHHYAQDSSPQPRNEFEVTVEETLPEPPTAQTDPRNQQQYRSPSPGYGPPSRPAPTQPPRNYPPQSNPQNFPPQAIPQQFPPQRGYYTAGLPVQAPPQHYPPQASPQTYAKAPPTSPYNSTGVNYQNRSSPMYATGGYAAPAPAPGYPQQSPYQYQKTQGTVGWSTGLFDCMDDPNNAIITACCPCFTFGQIAEIVDSGHTTCATSGILYGCIAAFTLAPCLISCTYRTKMRNQYDLVEVPAADWITHCFCEWCALCQEYRELKNRGLEPAIGWQGNMMRNQQQPQVAMMPPGNQTMQSPHAAM